VLADVEYLDRFEAALRTAGKLGDRLRQHRGRNGRGSTELAGLLASRLYVLDRALAGLGHETPPDAFLRLHPLGGSDEAEGSAFAATLASMYVAWGERRGMLVRRLDIEDGGEVFAVSGLGAATILAPEAGIHVLELPGDDEQRTVDRVAVGVELAPWPPTRGHGDEPPEAAAREALAEVSIATQVVRRYRYDPSPLVRDSVRRYRTGRLDRVLGGDFDVF